MFKGNFLSGSVQVLKVSGFRSVDQKERCLNLFISGESWERVKAERGSVKEGMLTCLLLVFVQLFERSLRLGIGIGVKS